MICLKDLESLIGSSKNRPENRPKAAPKMAPDQTAKSPLNHTPELPIFKLYISVGNLKLKLKPKMLPLNCHPGAGAAVRRPLEGERHAEERGRGSQDDGDQRAGKVLQG